MPENHDGVCENEMPLGSPEPAGTRLPEALVPCAVAVDLVILTIRDGRLCTLVVRRAIDPYLGEYALPGGFVREGEGLPEAAIRELEEETGLTAKLAHLEQLATYGNPGRDPRGRVVSVAYLAVLPDLPLPRAGGDAANAEFVPTEEVMAGRVVMAFDHASIVADGVERARGKLEYTTLATVFCAEEFSIADLRHVYESVWGVHLDERNFHRKISSTPGFVVPTGQRVLPRGSISAGRPAQLYRAGPARTLHPPIMRPVE